MGGVGRDRAESGLGLGVGWGKRERAGRWHGQSMADHHHQAHLEDVAQRHGAMGEAVHEERLQKALHIVEGMADAGKAGEGGRLSGMKGPQHGAPGPGPGPSPPHSLHDRVPAGREVVSVAVDEGHPEVEEKVDEKGSRVLCQEDLGVQGKAGHPKAAEEGGGGGGGGGLTVTQLI